MPLLERSSLSATLDHVDDALFYGRAIPRDDALEVVRWIATRFGAPSAYGRTFGITEQDELRTLHVYTGESLRGASLRHIHAEEACRILILLGRPLALELPELRQATDFLLECFARAESRGEPEGTYCCGPCTASLWRHMAAGGLGDYAKKLDVGLAVLPRHRDGKGSWRRFPFYYTLLALTESDTPTARAEIQYVLPLCQQKVLSLRNKSAYSRRKRDLLTRVLERYG